MARFSLTNLHGGTQQNLSTAYKTLLSLTAATGATTLRRAWIYDVEFGIDAAPADNTVLFKLDRQTTVGTATTVTASPLDASDAAALITQRANHTVEPTVTAASQLIEVPVNQRTTYRWVGLPGSELVVPAVDVTGIGARAKAAVYASTAICNLKFFE